MFLVGNSEFLQKAIAAQLEEIFSEIMTANCHNMVIV